MMHGNLAQAAAGRWVPAESVVVLDHGTVNARGAEGKRFALDNSAFQLNGFVGRAANGDLIVMTGIADPPSIVLLRSCDGGRSWSKPTPVWENTHPQEHFTYLVGMRVASAGRLLAIVSAEGLLRFDDGPVPVSQVVATLCSDDDGRTWETMPFQAHWAPFVPGQLCTEIFAEADGTLLLAVWAPLEPSNAKTRAAHYHTYTKWGLGFLRSCDGGRTWGEATVVLRGDPRTGAIPTEAVQARLRSGNQVCMYMTWWGEADDPDAARGRGPGFYARRIVSCDQGQSWSSPQTTMCFHANPALFELPDGHLLYCGRSYAGLRYLVSADEGQSWRYEQLLEAGGDCSVSGVALDDETFFLLHSSATGDPHYLPDGSPHDGYFYSGLRGRFLRRI